MRIYKVSNQDIVKKPCYFINFYFSRTTSSLLSTFTHRVEHKPLPHLSSVVINVRNSPIFIIPEKATFYFIGSLVHFYNRNKNLKNLIGSEQWLNDDLKTYIKTLADGTKWIERIGNWFIQRELEVIVNLLKSHVVQSNIDKETLLKLSYKIVACLNDNQLNDILYLFSNFIFNLNMYENRIEGVSMDIWKSLYAKVCVEEYLNNLNDQVSA